MIECWECGKKISERAESCPNCGAPKKSTAEKTLEDEKVLSGVKTFNKYATIALGIFILFAIIVIIPETNSGTTTSTNPQPTQQTAPAEKTIISDNLAEFKQNFFEGTDLQKQNRWDEVEDRWVRWTFYVKEVGTDVFGEIVVHGSISRVGQYDIGSDVLVRFKSGYEDELAELSKNQIITVEGQLTRYGNILETFDLTNADIVPTEDIQYATSGENSEDCLQLKQMCEQGADCLAYMQLQNQGLC